ncbi:MAG: shikimate kinase [Oscillospiraceae bacterium]
MNIDEARNMIDDIDTQILELFLCRMELCAQIFMQKAACGKNILDPAREENILSRVSEKSADMASYSCRLFEEMLSLSREYQGTLTPLSENPPKFGLLGEHLAHSFSPQIYEMLGIRNYKLIETTGDRLKDILGDVGYSGLNVTMPFKRDVVPLCDELSYEVRETGCANTLVRRSDGRLCAYNTDLGGFIFAAKLAKLDFTDKRVLVFGSGGASLAAVAASKRMGAASVTVVSRTGKVNYGNLDAYANSQIIINATPVGMFPGNLETIMSLERFTCCEGVFDMVYNPRRTMLIMDAEARGIPATDGLPMLVYQALIAARLFLDVNIAEGEALKILPKLRAQCGNIIIVGMPGSGKTTIGKEIANVTDRRFIDIDDEIEKTAGKPVAQLFAELGEEGFRQLEKQETILAGAQTGCVIATGGGVVKSMQNYCPLRQNGRIYCLLRPMEKLALEGRPLSKDFDALFQMRRERVPMYLDFADVAIGNNGTIPETAKLILEDYYENIGN